MARIRSAALVLALLPSLTPAGEAPAALRADAIAWLEAATATAPIDGVPSVGGATIAVIGVDRAANALVTRLDRSQMRVPLDRVDDRQLVDALATGGAARGADGVDGTVLAAAIAWADGDAPRTTALLAAAARFVGDADERVAARLAAVAVAPPPGRAERAAQAAADRDAKKRAGQDAIAEKQRKALERVNHAGRTLPPLPPIKEAIRFDTPEADAVLAALQVFPKDNAWNRDVAKASVHPRSADFVASGGAATNLHVDFGFNFIIVPADQAKVPVAIELAQESDAGPFPLPPSVPIEGWPAWWEPPLPLERIQREGDGDRHAIVVDPTHAMLYEFYQLRRTDAGWTAGTAATWDLKSNAMRHAEWTSADAAGLPMFPGVIRYDEVERGAVEHAVRMTVAKTRHAHVPPASHWASNLADDPRFPAMGQRFRLKASYDIAKLPPQARAIAKGLQTYGMIVADNGRDWDICCAIDKRFAAEQLRALQTITGADLEAVAEDPPAAKPGR